MAEGVDGAQPGPTRCRAGTSDTGAAPWEKLCVEELVICGRMAAFDPSRPEPKVQGTLCVSCVCHVASPHCLQ